MKDIMLEVLDGFEVKFLEENNSEYRCNCSRERVEKALISMGLDELTDIRNEGKTNEVTCQFCDEIYKFTPEDIGELIKKASK